MKEKTPLEWLLGGFFTLLISILVIWWVSMVVEGFYRLLVSCFTDPFKFVALVITIIFIYFWKQQEIHEATAILKEKVKKKKARI
ncbi:hypothetical protein LRS37_12905 [Neobacillus sedimentimangrovi]|uniref:PTS mannose transporter subunit IID n=1 Tax=Neobacillus sedimentimangrovi TaxID=2699460 RepID=A0ABS8QKC9_9BACI|nr:hypothetical protein [Neobacillus sedimentimangrovi]MCD4839749.1 hypothetical protein [Neobacillus sedimentimangrovi]